MRYALLLKPHANARYAQSLEKLALAELQCILRAWEIIGEPKLERIVGASFLTFDADEVQEQAWKAISKHSAICFASVVWEGLLRPLPLIREPYLSEDIAEVLKYKGKTNADFTTMALHCACAASDFAQANFPLTVLDPLCGRGTTLFCALREGHHAIGVEVDKRAVAEADAYFSRYLKYHRMKHCRKTSSLTLPEGRNAKEIRYSFANTPQRYQEVDLRTLRLLEGNTSDSESMLGRMSCHLLVGDFPYGVQHAPRQGGRHSSLQRLLEDAMPAYARILKKGGALALSFNTYTLARRTVENAMRGAGLAVLDQAPYSDFSHWVEQAVNRDLVVARKEN